MMAPRNSAVRPATGAVPDDGFDDDELATAEIEAARERTIEAAERCIVVMLKALGQTWQRCGKAACLRSRRCRGFACEREEFE